MQNAAVPHVIVAVTGEDERYRLVRRRAADLAAGHRGAVVLYDIDAAGVLASPVPTEVSADGEADLFAEDAAGQRLDPDALDTAGRPRIARQVRELRSGGIEAWGWLPTSRDVGVLAEYAQRVGAEVVLVPPGFEHPGIIERVLQREGTAEPGRQGAGGVRFEVVPDPGDT